MKENIFFPAENVILEEGRDISEGPQLDTVKRLRSLRSRSSVLDHVDIQPLVDDVVHGTSDQDVMDQGHEDQPQMVQGPDAQDQMEEGHVVPARRRNTANNKYKNISKRMSWNKVPQTPETLKTIPIYGGRIPFIVNEKQPMDYFRMFFDQEILQYICNESNRFSMQTDIDKPLCIDLKELEIFIGISFYMSMAKLPRTRYYWTSEIQMPAVTDYMKMRRWEIIKSNLHFADNDNLPERGSPDFDRIFKIRPFLNMLNERFNRIPMGESVSFDEQIIPYDGTRGPRIYT